MLTGYYALWAFIKVISFIPHSNSVADVKYESKKLIHVNLGMKKQIQDLSTDISAPISLLCHKYLVNKYLLSSH